MKNNYSTFQSPIHRTMKALKIKDRSEDSFNEFVWRVVTNMAYTHSVKDLHLFASEAYASYLWKYKKCDHYFLSDGIADFCVKSVKDLSEEFYKPFPEPESITTSIYPKWLQGTIAVNDDYTLKSGIVIHFPSKERIRSVMLIQRMALRHAEKFGLNPNYGEKHLCAIVDGEDILLPCGWNDVHKNRFDDDKGQDWLARLIFGLGLYVNAFPDAISPTEARGQVCTLASNKCYSVGASSVMDDECKNARSPHYRRGHFRILSSDRFTLKKNQTIFIKGTFVKGHAFDIQ